MSSLAAVGGPVYLEGTARPGSRVALEYSRFETGVGLLYVAYSGAAVRCTDLTDNETGFVQTCLARFGAQPEYRDPPPERLRRSVQDFLAGQGRFRGPLDLQGLPPFQQRVLRKTAEVRRGEVRSYGWIAREIGAPKAARAVGSALARNPIPILIPCHRVVRADYLVGDYGCGGPDKKRQILQQEGVDIEHLERLARHGLRFQGSSTTRIFCLPGCYTGRRTKSHYRVYFPSAESARASGFRPCKVCKPA
jgi:O-6-methylguanine DNA methyltransferase